MLPDRFRLRPITVDEEPAFLDAVALGFHEELREGEADLWRRFRHLDRTLAVFDGDAIVGTAEALPWEMSVPRRFGADGGSSLPCAAVTSVTVAATHRRRGLLRAMMERMLRDARDRDQPLAALYASEGGIYPRFGYGIAATEFDTTVERDHSALRRPVDVADRVSYVPAASAADLLSGIHDAVISTRPGAMHRVAAAWEATLVFDPASDRDGFGPRQVAVVDDRGYAIFRLRHGWVDNAPRNGVVRVEELLAVDAEAESILWSFLFGIDLMSRVEATGRPPDDRLRQLLVDPAREIRKFAKNLYVRIVDVPAALTGRGYHGSGRVVLRVHDPICGENDGGWELEIDDGAASCTPTDAVADLDLDVTELGAAYLGGVGFTALADVGLITVTDAAVLARTDRLFAADRAPWNPTDF